MTEETVICPNCGEANPPDLPFCGHCQWRLHDLNGELTESRRGRDAGEGPEPAAQAQGPGEPLPDWLSRLQEVSRELQPPAGGATDSAPPPPAHDADLLAGLTSQRESEDEDMPDWVSRIMGLSASGETETSSSNMAETLPEFDSTESGINPNSALTSAADAPLMTLEGGDQGEPGASNDEDEHLANSEFYEWLRMLDETSAEKEIPSQPRPPQPPQDVPSWVDDMTGVPDTPGRPAFGTQETVPGWVLGLDQGETNRSDEGTTGPSAEAADESGMSISVSAGNAPPGAGLQQAVPSEPIPPFRPEDLERLDVDSLFASMQMPEWLADVQGEKGNAAEEGQPASSVDDAILPGDLPSWVEALKPPDAAQIKPEPPKAVVRPEIRGPLLGMHGVLPVVPGAGQASSKPAPHAFRLEATEQHRAHAALLESILAAERQPASVRVSRQIGSRSLLRWGIALVLVLLLGVSTFTGSTVFSVPSTVPIESNAAIQAVQGLAPDAAVLVIVDYEPATVGEMEATAASLLDHLMLLKHPRIAVISSSPTGAALGEKLLTQTLQDRNYVRGQHYVNLGFLPGGIAGVQLFAQNPAVAIPLGPAADRVWDSPILQGIRGLSDFAAILLLTDSVEGGRAWIEQTQGARGNSPMIVVSGAQAGPMLVPYFDSGQLQGLVAGLNGAAGAEAANNGLPGIVRRYWDAYSLGMYAAAALFALGVAWHTWLLLRDRRGQRH